MSITQLQSQFTDPHRFGKSLRIERPAMAFAGLVLMFAVVGLLWNLRSTIRTLDNDFSAIGSSRFWRVFWSTLGEDQVTSVWLNFVVYGPPILLVLAALLFAYAMISQNALYRRLHQAYLERGYLALARETGLRVSTGKKGEVLSVDLLTHPSLSEQDNESLLQYVRQQVAAGGPQVVEWETTMSKARSTGRPFPLARYVPGTPEGPVLSIRKRDRQAVVVINPKPGKKATAVDAYDVK
ncbi:hypothetical protein IM660_15685 [Ruania alkalisoli]|uniref:Uncharacterized protein n=1 Tax=Ruania alkalisoli TaxID=2779775 RepID=A0A7M1SR79_9MICO|nr:hypothetical protein [Ruania alkalisoli]QOR70056.1 hypothetical protein IM660_15685 [Ruania alkalisoli]